MRNAGLAAAVVVAAAVLLLTGTGEDAGERADTRPAVEEVETVESLEPLEVSGDQRGLDDTLVLAQPLGDGGVLVDVDLPFGIAGRRVVGAGEWPAGLVEPTTDAAYPDAEAAARSPDGTRVAVFVRSSRNRATGISIYTEGRTARQFHRLQSVGSVVSKRLVWSRDGDAVYFLAASEEGSADRVIGVPVGGSPQTVVSFRERGFYGIGTV